MTATIDIALTAAGLKAGERVYVTCPACGGGTKKRSTLLLEKSSSGRGHSWYCFRNACDCWGNHGDAEYKHSAGKDQRHIRNNYRPYRGSLSELTDEQREFLFLRVGWKPWHVELAHAAWSPTFGRFAFSIFGPLGQRNGWVLRSWEPHTDAKALTRLERGDTHFSYYSTFDRRKPLIVVEDIPSAVRAAKYHNAVALNGTGVSLQGATEIAAHFPNVVWALDRDALQQAVRLHQRHGVLFDTSHVLVLDDDLKDMDEEPLRELMETIE